MAANRTKHTRRTHGANGASENMPTDAQLSAGGANSTTGAAGASGANGDTTGRRRITLTLTEDDHARFVACLTRQMDRLAAGAGSGPSPDLPDSTMGLHIFRLGLSQREALNAVESRKAG